MPNTKGNRTDQIDAKAAADRVRHGGTAPPGTGAMSGDASRVVATGKDLKEALPVLLPDSTVLTGRREAPGAGMIAASRANLLPPCPKSMCPSSRRSGVSNPWRAR